MEEMRRGRRPSEMGVYSTTHYRDFTGGPSAGPDTQKSSLLDKNGNPIVKPKPAFGFRNENETST